MLQISQKISINSIPCHVISLIFAINKRYERKFGYLNYFTYLRAAFLKKPRSLLC